MKKIIPYLLLFTIITLLLANCEKETFLPTSKLESTQNAVKVNFVKLSDIPQIKDFLVDKTNDNLFKSTVIDGAIFDEDHIMEVIDTLQHTNYSFRFRYTDTHVGTFYNLIVGKTPEGENETPYVLKYVCNESQFDEYITHNFDFRFFKGKVAIHKYTDFFSVGSILKAGSGCPTNTDENGNLIPCEEGTIIGNGDNSDSDNTQDGGNTGGGDGPNTGDGPNDNGGTTGNTNNDSGGTDNNGSGSNNSDSDGTSEGGGGLCFVQYHTFDENGDYYSTIGGYVDCDGSHDHGQANPVSTTNTVTSKSGNDCPECIVPIGPIGVLVEEEIIVDPLFEKEFPCQSEIVKNTFLETAPLSQLILNIFDDDSSGYNLVFDVDYSLGDGIAGGTYPISVNSEWDLEKLDIKVGLSEALLNNGTDLAIATTVIHESIHAALIYMVETGKLTIENTNDDFNLNTLVRSYLEMKIELDLFPNEEPSAGDTDAWMHDYMTDLVEDIATSVSAFGNSKGYNIPFSYYKKLAWLGLKDSLELLLADDSDGFTQDDQAEVDAINTVIEDEFLNRTNAKGEKCTNN